MHCQNAAYDVFVDLDTEGQRDLLGNSRAAPTGITPFHFNDGIDEFFGRSFRTSPTAVFGGEQLSVLSFDQHLVEMQQSRRPENDRGSHNPCRTHEKGAQTGDDPIRNAEVGSSFPTAIQNQQLMSHHKNLFGTVLTYAAPSSNYRGESEENRTILQKITKGGKEYSIISPESMRNALRELLIRQGLPCNRSRLYTEDQLAVEFIEFPNADKYGDDFFFGFMVADKDAIKKNKGLPPKRDSVFRMNVAVALTPYRFNAIFHQSPLNAGKSPWKNASTSALIHREIAHTAYQYPFALSQSDCKQGKPEWTKTLLDAIAQLNKVPGGHARSYYEMSPATIVVRLTPSLVAGYNTYGFDESGNFSELGRINKNDLPGKEFWLGGEMVRKMAAGERQRLEGEGVKLYENPQRLLADVTGAFLG